jgi:hypothetical protein
MFADDPGECQAQIRVDIDLAHRHGRGLTQHFFRNATRVVRGVPNNTKSRTGAPVGFE